MSHFTNFSNGHLFSLNSFDNLFKFELVYYSDPLNQRDLKYQTMIRHQIWCSSHTTLLSCDNLFIYLGANPTLHSCSKTFWRFSYHYILEVVAIDLITTKHSSSSTTCCIHLHQTFTTTSFHWLQSQTWFVGVLHSKFELGYLWTHVKNNLMQPKLHMSILQAHSAKTEHA